jgi:hypothetical protein
MALMNLSSLVILYPLTVFRFGQHGAPFETRTSGLVVDVTSKAVSYVARGGDQRGSKRGAEHQRQSYTSHVALPFVGGAEQTMTVTMSPRFHGGDIEGYGAPDWRDGHEGLKGRHMARAHQLALEVIASVEAKATGSL